MDNSTDPVLWQSLQQLQFLQQVLHCTEHFHRPSCHSNPCDETWDCSCYESCGCYKMRKRKNFLWQRCTMPWQTVLWSLQSLQWAPCFSSFCDGSCSYSNFCNKPCGSSNSCSCFKHLTSLVVPPTISLSSAVVPTPVTGPVAVSSPAMNPTVDEVASLLWQYEDSLCEGLCLNCWKNSFSGSKKKREVQWFLYLYKPVFYTLELSVLLFERENIVGTHHILSCGLTCVTMERIWGSRMENQPPTGTRE